jgi:hypothetical protein
MIDLYAMGSPNVVKIYIALEEMRLLYCVCFIQCTPSTSLAKSSSSPSF